MDDKKKKKVLISISAILILAIVAVSAYFLIKPLLKNKQDNNQAENISTEEIINRLNEAQKAIAQQEFSLDYNGNYIFYDISHIKFNKDLTYNQILKLCESKGTSDPNSLKAYLKQTKINDFKTKNEIITLKNGHYTKTQTINGKSNIERGVYFGNNDLSDIKFLKNGTYISKHQMSLTSIKSAEIASNTLVQYNPDNKLLFFYENVYSTADENLILFTITYVYEYVKDTTNIIPNFKLDF